MTIATCTTSITSTPTKATKGRSRIRIPIATRRYATAMRTFLTCITAIATVSAHWYFSR